MVDPIVALIVHLYTELGQLTGGPLHIVLDDGNVEDSHLDFVFRDENYAHLRDGTYRSYANPGERTDEQFMAQIEATCRAIVIMLCVLPEEERRAVVSLGWDMAHDILRRSV